MAQTRVHSRKKTVIGSTHNVERHHYSVGWSKEDRAFVARVTEFPSLAAHGNTLKAALQEIKKVVRAVLKDLATSKNYNGPCECKSCSH